MPPRNAECGAMGLGAGIAMGLTCLLLVSCMPHAVREQRAYTLCPVDRSTWSWMAEPPADARALAAPARAAMSAQTHNARPRMRLYWFTNPAGDLLLCLPEPRDHCGMDQTWHYQRVGEAWVLDPLQTLTVCN